MRAIEGYAPVNISCLMLDSTIPCDLYSPTVSDDGKGVECRLLIAVGTPYNQELQDSLVRDGIEEVFVETEKLDAFLTYSLKNSSQVAESPSVPAEAKMRLLYENAVLVVRKAFDGMLSPASVRIGQEFIENCTAHLAMSKPSADTLFPLFPKDYGTYTHCAQVALLGMSFGQYLGWTVGEIAEFGVGALFHDVGKSRIPDSILNKPSGLDEKEYESVKKHPLLGYQQLAATGTMTEDQLNIVLSHHEAFDGSGYPNGLRGGEIPEHARVTRIVDCFDAMVSDRCYKEAFPREKALRVMKNEMSQTFDTVLLDAFIRFLRADPSSECEVTGDLNVSLGCDFIVQCESAEFRIKTKLVGMESGLLLIVRPPQLTQILACFRPPQRVIVRYLHAGVVYGFKAEVLNVLTDPSFLLLISYPHRIETVNLRQNPRIDCFLFSEAEIQGHIVEGVIVDLSTGGCRFFMKNPDGESSFVRQLDDPITLRTELMGRGTSVALRGKVRHIKLDETRIDLGIQFTDHDRGTHEKLADCVQKALAIVPSGRV